MSEPFVRLELEDRAYLERLEEMPMTFKTFGRPDEIDVAWHRDENQGRIGSCQSNALTSILERIQYVQSNDKSKVVQLSKIFGYLATQKIDRLLGQDSGSTISGGAKLALTVGVCPESLTGYPARYPDGASIRKILSQDNYNAAAPYRALKSWRASSDVEECMSFIAGGGGINIGVVWYNGLIPRDRVVRSFNPPARGGGHAMSILGYTRSGNLIGMNSWGDGKYEITPTAWKQMINHRFTAAVGLTGTLEPRKVKWEDELVFIPDDALEANDDPNAQTSIG